MRRGNALLAESVKGYGAPWLGDYDAKHGIRTRVRELASPSGRRAHDLRASVPAFRFRVRSRLAQSCSKPPSLPIRPERTSDNRRSLWLRDSLCKPRADRRTPFDVQDLEAGLLAASGDKSGVRVPLRRAEWLGEVVPRHPHGLAALPPASGPSHDPRRRASVGHARGIAAVHALQVRAPAQSGART